MHWINVETAERAQIEHLIADVFGGELSLEMPSFLSEATIFSHRLPERLRRAFNDFRLREVWTGLCVKGNPIWEDELPATPSGYRGGGQVESVDRPAALHVLYACLLGDPFSWTTIQNGYIINDILPIQENADRPVSSGSNRLFDLHTEDAFHRYAGDYLGLMCLRNPDRVPTILAAIDDVELPPDVKDILFQPLFIVSPNIAHGVAKTADRVPVLFGNRQRPYLRINVNVVEQIDEDPEAQRALRFLIEALRRHAWELILEPGDCCFIDNFRSVHGRAPYLPRYDGGDRWLKRLYVTSSFRNSRDLRLHPQSRMIRPHNAVHDEVVEVVDVRFAVGEEVLSGHILTDDRGVPPRLLFLHGAGEATKERARPLALELARRGIASFGFDFSGHGRSSGTLSSSSLSKRSEEAAGALPFLAPGRPISLCGFSMGAHVALEMLRRAPVENLFLFYPAVYSRDAFDLPFGERFSAAIRRPGSWRDAAVLDALEEFTGNLLIFVGEDDSVIPREVIELVKGRAERARHKEVIVFPGAGHRLLDRIYADERLVQDVVMRLGQAMLDSESPVDGCFVGLEDIEKASAQGTKIYAPVSQPKDPQRDPYKPLETDPPAVASRAARASPASPGRPPPRRPCGQAQRGRARG